MLHVSSKINHLEAQVFSMTQCARRYVRLQYIANSQLTWSTAANYLPKQELRSPTMQPANARQATADSTALKIFCGLKNHVTAKARGRVGKMTEEGHSRPSQTWNRIYVGGRAPALHGVHTAGTWTCCASGQITCAMTRFFRHSGTTVTRAGRDWRRRIGRKRFACTTHTPVAGHV
jgi:hypothetical protein